ncbi:MAG: UDP-3-O-(3-hydroxymyristoyl)glucosamine N-acyltransferase [Candidatus Omnitrophica bacterium]|nr:UDP-3-O-(3-hydroxymyristoyl)glucosamine N-acyltransferase [Candidatus Omnitrophota bacterium]MCB9747599.1 UDP-3-O-(3-hydroxymyristoyl)glucosamine N-acyltransferase [Candidatus Omnitrophota bacterium]
MKKTLTEIAGIIEGEVVGDGSLIIHGLNGIKEACEGELTFIANSKYLSLLKTTQASAVITPRDMTVPGKAIIRTDNPSLAFAKAAELFGQGVVPHFQGIHPRAVIADDVQLGEKVAVGANVIIESGCHIGDNAVIYGNCYIGHNVRIGSSTIIYPNVTIREKTVIGKRCIVNSGSVIGSDGFGYEQISGEHVKIPQLGIVCIEDNVEIGACVTIDRARFDKTIIKRGSKIDNLVQIAHNVVIEENCIIISQVGIAGSVTVGKNSILAGQAGVAGHLTIGENTTVAAKAGVTHSVEPNSIVSGFPAKPHAQVKKVNAVLQRLPIYIKRLKDLEKRVEKIEGTDQS